MKKTITIIAAALALMACQHKELAEPVGERSMVEFTVGDIEGDGTVTRATSAGNETTVNSLQVVLFKSGIVYAVGTSTGNSVSINVEAGTYNIYAFVNDSNTWTTNASLTEAGILATVSNLSEESVSAFKMFGYREGVAVSSAAVTIPVSRFVSKVEVDKLSVNFDDVPYLNGKSVTLNGIYLTNVYSKLAYNKTPATAPSASETWYNKMQYTSAGTTINAMLAETGLTTSIADNSSNNTAHYFYCIPNGSSTLTEGGTWSSRVTRIVFQCTVNSKTCYYHADIPQMQPNSIYKFTEVTFKNMGGDDPEHNLEKVAIAFQLEITSWQTGFSKPVTFD